MTRNIDKVIKRIIQEEVFSNLHPVEPRKKNYQKPIPNPNILPDCYDVMMKSKDNMVSFSTDTLNLSDQKRVDDVSIVFNPNAHSDEMGITVMKDGDPFCFVKK
jgi:hypothetical protein